MSRRGVLTGAAALAGMTALPQLLTSRPGMQFDHVVVDERLPQSAAFARGLAGRHVHVVNALDDLCNRWYTQLRSAVLADAGAIAGLTKWMDYVVMRGCAAEIGYLSTFHAEHRPTATAAVQPHAWAQSLGSALARGSRLPAQLLPAQDAAGMHMVTWVFTPRH